MIDSAQDNKPQAVNVGAQRVAAIYAKAFLGAVGKGQAGSAEAAVGELAAVADALSQFPKLADVLGSALVATDEKLEILQRVFGNKLSPLVLDTLKVLARKGRLDITREVYAEVQRQFDAERGRVRVDVVTATPIDGGLANSLAQSLRRILGGEPQVSSSVQPELIGGVVLRVGDTVYDGSVARQLDQAREQMINRSVHEIQSRRDRFRHSGGN